MTINARSDDDVDPEDIIQTVAKAAGVNYSLHKESNSNSKFNDSGPALPVVRPGLMKHVHNEETTLVDLCRE